MQWLDLKTIMFSYGLINIVSLLVMAQLWRQNRKRFAGLSLWLLCYALQAAGGLLGGLRGHAPDFVTIVLANVCLLVGTSALCAGLASFTGLPCTPHANALILSGFVGFMSYFTYIHPDFATRAILVSVTQSLIILPCSWRLLRRVEPRLQPITRFVGGALLVHVFTALARIVVAVLEPSADAYFPSQMSNTLFILIYQSLNLVMVFALVLMTNRRLILELQTQQARLQHSEEKFTKAFHASPDAILISRLSDQRIIEVNEGFVQLTGYTREETLSKSSPVLDLWDNADDRAAWTAALQTRQSIRDREYDFRSKSGDILHCLYAGEYIRIEDEDCVLSVVRDISARKRMENVLTFLAQHAAMPQENFFQALARYLAENLDADYVCIDQLEGDNLSARTVAIYSDGKFEDNMTYTLQDTPCGNVVGKTVCCFPAEVRRLFPRDAVLQEMAAESYVGVTLWSYTGRPIGLIAVIGRRPLANTDLAESLLKLAAVRAAGELERKQAEEVLRESEEKFYNVFHFNPVAMSLSTLAEGRFLDVNAEFLRLIERTRAEVIGRTSLEIQAWTAQEQRDQVIARLRESGAVRDLEVEVRATSGKLVQVLWSAEIVAINGEPRLLASAKDITARKQAELALKLNEQRLEALLKLSQMTECSEQELADFALEEAVRLTESDIGYLHYVHEDQVNLSLFSWSKEVVKACAAAKTAHYPLSEAGIWADCVRERRPVIHNDYPALLDKKGLPSGHVPLMRHMSIPVFDGERIVAIAGVGNKAQPYNDADVRQLSLFMTNLWHIFRRKRAEESLLKSDRRLRETQAIAQLGEWELDLTTNTLFWSEEIYRIFDIDPAQFEVSYEAFLGMVHPEDRAMVNQAYLDSVKTRIPYEIVHRLQLADGAIKFVRELCRTEYNQDGKPTRSIGAVQDITALKRVEEELRSAKAEAERANRAKSDFLAHMSHELRTPLNGILGYAQILKRAPGLSATQRHGLDIIERSGNLLLNLIAEILDLAKIEAQKVELQPVEVTFAEFLRGITAMIAVRVQQKGIEFRYEPAPDLPDAIRADQQRLGQVLLNLLNNAVKFTERGYVTLRVARQSRALTLQPVEASQSRALTLLHFEIEDTGPGIAAEDLEAIFDPFRQVGAAAQKAQGAGLGLAISRELVQLMGGELHVTSTPGQGSTFWFDLTCPEVTRPLSIPTISQTVVVGFEGTCKILIVDDHAENRQVLRDMLTPLGFDLREAAGGAEALDLTLAWIPDAILLDLMMPGMDGFETARRIRQAGLPARPVILAVSASAFQETQQKIVQAGCDDFLAKPVQFDRLIAQLQTHLPLNWVYARSDVPAPEQAAAPIIPPPQSELTRLYEAARIGDIIELRRDLQRLETLSPEYAGFVAALQPLVKHLQLNAIRTFLEQYQHVSDYDVPPAISPE